MYNKLLSNKTAAEKKDLKELMVISKPLLKAILEALEKDIEETEVTDLKDFDAPSWALKTAYKQGLKKGLTKLKEYVII